MKTEQLLEGIPNAYDRGLILPSINIAMKQNIPLASKGDKIIISDQKVKSGVDELVAKLTEIMRDTGAVVSFFNNKLFNKLGKYSIEKNRLHFYFVVKGSGDTTSFMEHALNFIRGSWSLQQMMDYEVNTIYCRNIELIKQKVRGKEFYINGGIASNVRISGKHVKRIITHTEQLSIPWNIKEIEAVLTIPGLTKIHVQRNYDVSEEVCTALAALFEKHIGLADPTEFQNEMIRQGYKDWL